MLFGIWRERDITIRTDIKRKWEQVKFYITKGTLIGYSTNLQENFQKFTVAVNLIKIWKHKF